ncbi:MAG TPA: histidine kinase [Ilumatobacteraceae bacterium]|nr:histidine kinase [Ilumatobacteraceae bacterium]
MGGGRSDTSIKSLRGPIGLSILITALTLAGVGIAWEWLFQRTSESSAIDEFARTDRISGRAILEPFIVDELLTGDKGAHDRLVQAGNALINGGGAVHVTVWAEDGTLLWSDIPKLTGHLTDIDGENEEAEHAINFDAEEHALLSSQGTQVELHTLIGNEIPLVSVDFGAKTPAGEPVVVEIFYPANLLSNLASQQRDRFRPLLFLGLGLLIVAQLPLTLALSRRRKALAAQREDLVRRSVTTSDNERRRIAAEVHDGPVQDLIGIAMGLSAATEMAPSPLDDDLRDLAGEARSTVRSLRSLLNNIYPVDVPDEGWVRGLDPMVEALRERGVVVDLDVPETALAPTSELLMLRVGREALRNVSAHSDASNVSIKLGRTGSTVTLDIVDDGVGFDDEVASNQRHAGHLGLQLLQDLAEDTGATLLIDSEPGRGTNVHLALEESR